MKLLSTEPTFMAFMADLVIDIIFARDIGGFMSIMENNCNEERGEVVSTLSAARTLNGRVRQDLGKEHFASLSMTGLFYKVHKQYQQQYHKH